MSSWFRISEASPSTRTILLSVVVTLLTSLCIRYFKKKRLFAIVDKLPGPHPFALLDYIKFVRSNAIDFFHFLFGYSYICSFTSSLYRIRFGNTIRVILVKARAVEVILSSNKHLDKGPEYRFLHPWLGTGLLTATGKKWQSRRKLLTPAFHFKILEDFVEVFNKQSEVLVSKLKVKADGSAFNIFPFITLCTLDIICETAMGYSVHAQEQEDSAYVKAVSRIAMLLKRRMISPWEHFQFTYKLLGKEKEQREYLDILHGFTQRAIKERRKIHEAIKKCDSNGGDDNDSIGKKKRLAFLDQLLQYTVDGRPLSDGEIQEEVDTFMFEGHDTTTTAINWFLYAIGGEPHIQSKIHEELDSILGDFDRPATMADLRELKYLERCIKETLRLYPSVPFVGRQTKEDLVIDNHRIPIGCKVQVCTYRLHRDPEQFPKPHTFDPDRFLPENCEKRHPYAYVPFSAGPRNCIGQKFALMEEKIVLSTILRNYRVESTTRREDLKVVSELILKPLDGNIVRLFPRK